MKRTNDFIKYFKRWLISHYSEFPYKPYIVRDLKYRGNYILKFNSIHNIEVAIKADGTFDMWYKLEYNGKEYLDNPLDLYSIIKRNHKGYYCDLCIERIYYKNKINLWEEHLKEFLDWSKENLKNNNQFILEIFKNDSFKIYIESKNIVRKYYKNKNIVSFDIKN